MIVNGAEHQLLCCHQRGSLAALMTLTFSAKESLFKMNYPQTGKSFGFSMHNLSHLMKKNAALRWS
jgi:enterobactin synthetase component D